MIGGGAGHIDEMNKRIMSNKALLRGRSRFKERRALYYGVLGKYVKSQNKNISEEERRKIREEVREVLRRRNRFNNRLLFLSIVIGLCVVVFLIVTFLV